METYTAAEKKLYLIIANHSVVDEWDEMYTVIGRPWKIEIIDKGQTIISRVCIVIGAPYIRLHFIFIRNRTLLIGSVDIQRIDNLQEYIPVEAQPAVDTEKLRIV